MRARGALSSRATLLTDVSVRAEPVDLRGVDLGEVVRIDLREVTVYPDDGDAAPRGTGLNKPALVALLQCCDVDSATGDVALAGAAKWRAACVTQCHRSGAMFVDYVAERGLWVFSVNHFSRYGFDDSDSDDDGAPAGQRPPPARGAAAQAGAAGAAGLRSALRPAGAAVQQGGATPAGARGARVEFAPSTKGGRARAGADDDDDGGDDDDDGAGPRMLVPRVSYSRSVQDVTGVDEGAYADDGDDAGAAGSSRFTGGASAVPSAGPLGSLPSASVADMFDGATADGVDGGADASTAPPYGMQLLLGRPPMTVADTAPLVGEVRSFVMVRGREPTRLRAHSC